jgi:hypothetical protein
MPAHPRRPASAKPGKASGGWSRGTPPARRPRDENRAPDTLVDATSCAIADAGSIPAVSTVWLGDGASGALFGGNTWCLVLEPLRVRLHRRLKVRVITVPVDPERRGQVRNGPAPDRPAGRRPRDPDPHGRRKDSRFDRAAARWVGRLLAETPIGLAENRWALALVEQLPACAETLRRLASRR